MCGPKKNTLWSRLRSTELTAGRRAFKVMAPPFSEFPGEPKRNTFTLPSPSRERGTEETETPSPYPLPFDLAQGRPSRERGETATAKQ